MYLIKNQVIKNNPKNRKIKFEKINFLFILMFFYNSESLEKNRDI